MLGTTGQQAVRHGIRGAVQAACLSAAVLAAAGVLGARGPVVLSEPSLQAAPQQQIAVNASPASSAVSVPVAARVTTR